MVNFIHPDLEIKMTKDKGRGVFATKLIKANVILAVERPIVTYHNQVDIKPHHTKDQIEEMWA